jgi:WD40 repeat protein
MDQRAIGSAIVAEAVGWGADERNLKIFVSYSRGDSADFALRLVAALEKLSIAAKLDTRDLEFGERWQNQLKDFIRQADAVVFIVSPRSISSHWCRWEVAEVATQSKRLVPVLHKAVPPEDLPAEISDVQLFSFGADAGALADAEFEDHTKRLAEGLLRDRPWLQEHTRLTELAHTWLVESRSRDHLLRGRALRAAEEWMVRRPLSAPAPSQAHLEFIAAGQVAAKKGTRRWIGGLTAVAVAGVTLAGIALYQAGIARSKTEEALTNLNEALINQSRLVAGLSKQELSSGDAGTALALALEALPPPDAPDRRPFVAEAADQARSALDSLREQAVIQASGRVLAANLSPDGKLVAVSSANEQWKLVTALFDAQTGHHLGNLGLEQPESSASPDSHVEFSSTGARLLAWDGMSLRLFDVQSRELVSSIADEEGRFTAATLDAGDTVWVGYSDGTVGVWEWGTAATVVPVARHAHSKVLNIAASDNDKVASVSADGGLYILDTAIRGSQPVSELRAVEGQTYSARPFRDIALAFESFSTRLLTVPIVGDLAPKDRKARVWDTSSGTMDAEIAAENAKDSGFSGGGFLHGEPTLAVNQSGGGVRLSTRPDPLLGNGELLWETKFDELGSVLVTSNGDSSISMWHGEDSFLKPAITVRGHTETIGQFYLNSREGKALSLSADSTVRVWNVGKLPASFATPKKWEHGEAVDLIHRARAALPRCLTLEQRKRFLLDPLPPRWCITGGEAEAERDPAKWVGKWPNHTQEWRDWLAARDAGREVPVPSDPKWF